MDNHKKFALFMDTVAALATESIERFVAEKNLPSGMGTKAWELSRYIRLDLVLSTEDGDIQDMMTLQVISAVLAEYMVRLVLQGKHTDRVHEALIGHAMLIYDSRVVHMELVKREEAMAE